MGVYTILMPSHIILWVVCVISLSFSHPPLISRSVCLCIVPAQSAPLSTLQRAQGHINDVTHGMNTMSVGGMFIKCKWYYSDLTNMY